ncbi:MAG: hypothetical protein COA79_08140 [Planctomycetota bacterium]|nr:MAG: hypothetical protein COA79_08140 [Planctomycetota bacterium]
MSRKISVQLYSVREDLKKDYEAGIRKISDMGFTHVEPAGFPGYTAEKAAKLFKELNLESLTCHGNLPIGEDKNKIIEEAQLLGIKYIYTGCPPGYPDCFKSVDAIKALADTFNEAAEFASQYGIQVGNHNHTYEMLDIDGKPAYEYFLEATPETVLWEADIYWVMAGGRSIPEFIQRLGKRAVALHFKDGIVGATEQELEVQQSDSGLVAKEREFLPAGEGEVPLLEASEAAIDTEIAVVELDSYNGNMMEAIQKSYTYFTKNNIAKGNV